jgi:hypothetical protein
VRKRSTVVAWSMLAVYVASVSVGYLLMVTNGIFQDDPANQLGLLLTFTAFMVVGAVIVARRPDNTIGWIFSAIGLLAGTGTPAWQYAEYAYAARGGALPGAILGAWYTPLWFYSAIGLAFVFTPLLFPTGRLLSPRWRPIALLAAVTTAALVVLSAVDPTLTVQSEGYSVRNPIGVTGVPDLDNSALGEVLIGLFNLCIGAAVLSLVLRFRRSHGVQRQQLKWFTYAGALMFLWLVLGDYLLPNLAILGALWNHLRPGPDGHWRGHPALSAVRHRPADQPYPGLWAAYRPAGWHLRRRRPGPRPGVRWGRSGPAELGGSRRDPGRRCLVPAGPPSHPAGR